MLKTLSKLSGTAALTLSLGDSLPRKRVRWRLIKNNLPALTASDACADLGTSNGGIAYYFAKEGHWYYVDRSAYQLGIAREFVQGECVAQDMETFLKDGKKFKTIVLSDLIMYLPKGTPVIRQIAESLAPGGRFIVTGKTPHSMDLLTKIRSLLGLEQALGYVQQPSLEEVTQLAKEAGLQPVTSASFHGFFGELLLFFIDAAVISEKGDGDRLTQEHPLQSHTEVRKKLIAAKAVRILSIGAEFLDRLTPFLPRYGYLLAADKKSA